MAESELGNQVEALKEDLSKLRSDVADLVNQLVAMGKSEAGEAKEKLESETMKKVEELRSFVAGARERGKQAATTVEEQVRERPLLALLGAFGIGFLVGKILDRD